ncbi:MAG: hypothetical protein K0S76_2186 [Herbinix sp.]|jgi:hypothetical protein|nr:hypothetical protein [Herbinix sp.]
MAEVNGIKNIDQTNGYRLTPGKNSGVSSTGFSSYLPETKSMDDIFEQAANKYNIPVDLLKAIGKAESDFNPKAVSRCGAQGIMQLMPKTAAYLGVKDSFDPEQNIMGGAKYIAELLDQYDGDTKLALAAYNAGMNNVKKYGGIPPFKETQNYVVKVTNYMKQGVDAPDTAVKTISPVSTPRIANFNYVALTPPAPVEEADNNLEDIFSELDYMKLLELFLEEDNEKEREKESKNL